MRRLLATLGLAVLTLGLSPVPAQAYFWDWIDSLSGPEFGGEMYELRLWCHIDRGDAALARFDAAVASDLEAHRLPSPASTLHARFVQRGHTALGHAQKFAALARAVRAGTSSYDASEAFMEALRWRKFARRQFALGERARSTPTDAYLLAAAEQPLPALTVLNVRTPHDLKIRRLVSECRTEALDRHKGFLSLNTSYGHRDSNGDPDANNRLFTVGAAYHWVIAPWISAGTGGGIARFTSRPIPSTESDAFWKLHLEPVLVDIRPFAVLQAKYSANPWPQLVYFRFSVTTFPQGFEAGSFGGNSPKFDREFVRSVGLHFDLEPPLRKLRNAY